MKPVELPSFDEMKKRRGVYWDKRVLEEQLEKLDRFTIYVYVRGEEDCAEEIDVDALTKLHALEIARAAWKRDYQGPVRKMEVKGPRTGLYM